MTFWEFFGAVTSAASLISLALALSSLYNGRATRRLMRQMGGETQSLMREMSGEAQARLDRAQELIAQGEAHMQTRLDRVQELIAQGDARTQELIDRLHAETLAVLERIDQRADERQREVIEAIRALRP